jgi:hypothetical protein
MYIMMLDKEKIEHALKALGETLEHNNAPFTELVVCGGAALNVMGLVKRTTRDVDVLAMIKRVGNVFSIERVETLPQYLLDAINEVARVIGLPDAWLNTGPKDLVRFGLPEGIETRLTTKEYGKRLFIYYVGRTDQIHFKLFAAADQGLGRHFDDLLALEPSADEIESATHWAYTQDPSDGFKMVLRSMLEQLGYGNITQRI